MTSSERAQRENEIRLYLATIGRRGGEKSRRKLSSEEARAMQAASVEARRKAKRKKARKK